MAGQYPHTGGVSGSASSSGGLDKVRAPYTFVPLSEHVFRPSWAEFASQDVPFEDGVCGTLDLQLETLSPLFVRGARDPKTFYETPNKTIGIPGSSIRGAIRNVVEIATFSSLHRINNTRFAVRDLQNRDLYGKHMAEIMKGPDGKGVPTPLVNAGWLIPATQDEVDRGIGGWIIPCGFAKIHYKSLLEIARNRGKESFSPGRRQKSPEKYKAWLGDLGREHNDRRLEALRVEFVFQPQREKNVTRGLLSSYGKALLPTGAQSEQIKRGHLVFTGQPNTWDPFRPPMKRSGAGNPKQHDFVFFGYILEGEKRAMALPISVEQLADFESIHADGAQQGRATLKPNEEWGYWSPLFEKAREAAEKSVNDRDRGPNGDDESLTVRFQRSPSGIYSMLEAEFVSQRPLGVPVFFLADRKPAPREIVDKRRAYTVLKETFVRSFGLAMMFRLAYAHTVSDGRGQQHRVQSAGPNVAPKDIPPNFDFAEALFGHVPIDSFERSSRGERALLKGRVSFETALRINGHADSRVGPVVLSAPKASFYPSYIEQRPDSEPGAGPQGEWQTYQNDEFRLRGWKRYRPLDAPINPPRPKDGKGIAFNEEKMQKLGTTFTPIQRGAKFTTRMHLHNVKLAELGALLWALDFGGEGSGNASDRPRHVMGLGRSIGFGQVQFSIQGGTLYQNAESQDAPAMESILERARETFIAEMEAFAADKRDLGGWAASRQIYELVESSRPIAAADGRHMQIDHPGNGNEFVAAKKSRKALSPAGHSSGWQRWKAEHPATARSALATSNSLTSPTTSTQSSSTAGPGPVPTERKPWARQPPGTTVRARLVSVTGSGNWKADLIDWQASGTVFGKAPVGTYLNDVTELVVTDGIDGKNLRLKWSGQGGKGAP